MKKPPIECNTAEIQAMFNRIAKCYDVLNRLLSLRIDVGWRKRFVQAVLEPQQPLQVLDVACGTGDVAIALAHTMLRQQYPSSTIIGVDIAQEMLAIMQAKIQRQHLQSIITTQLGDAQQLVFADQRFDVVTVAMGVRNFADKQQGLAQLYRVLKPGGRLLILELSMPTNPLIRSIYGCYFKLLLPRIGGLVSGDRAAYEYLYTSVQAFPPPAQFVTMIQAVGFQEVQYQSLTFGTCTLYRAYKPASDEVLSQAQTNRT